MKKTMRSLLPCLVLGSALFLPVLSNAAWPTFTKMGKWKKEMGEAWNSGSPDDTRSVMAELINLRRKQDPTKEDMEKMAFLEVLTQE